jgi:hypothetical protein
VEQWHAEAEEMLPEGTEVDYLVGPETGHRRAVMLMQTATAASLAMGGGGRGAPPPPPLVLSGHAASLASY